jgi:ornithine decarboxylase
MIKRAHRIIHNALRPTPKPPRGDAFNPSYLSLLPYKTPFFLFSKRKILSNLDDYKKFFPGSRIQFAMKANSERDVLEILADAGSGFEVASIYELELLKKIRVAPEKIVYGTSVKPADHIKVFYKYGVDRFAFDSFSELEKIAANAPSSKVYVRVFANDAGSVFKFSEKFGTDPSSVIPLLVRAKEFGLRPYGISFHVGSQASDPYAWANVLVILQSIIADLEEKGIPIQVVDIGGGYPCQSASATVPKLKEIAKYTNAAFKKLPSGLEMMLEPGRGMIADTAIAVATVIARIERRGNTWLFLDLGVYNGLFETMAYQGSTRYQISSMRAIGDAGESMFAIAGPTGDSPDVITKEALLPSDIMEGDKVILHNVGAYTLSVTSEFNGFPKPDVYTV